MDYEKAYNEALERARKLKETCDSTAVIGWCEYIFPELKESEDERIRKEIINTIKFQKEQLCHIDGATYDRLIAWLEKQKEPEDKGEISDGYHTFNELYYYRMLYNAAFFNHLPKEWVHKSKRHHDGEECFGGGWFIVMANLPTGQISNHYELKDWELFQIPEKEIADEWDGHTPQEAANRLYKYLLESKTNAVPNSQSEDEKIREEIIEHLRLEIETECTLSEEEGNRWIAWLEKQGEQKLAWSQGDEDMLDSALNLAHEYGRHGLWCWLKSLKQKIGVQDEQKSLYKPKFNVGDWIIFYGDALRISEIIQESSCYRTISTTGLHNSYDWSLDNTARLWTLKDARDGDVLVDNKRPFIFKGFLDSQHPNHPVAYCGIDTEDLFICSSGNYWWTENKDDIKPATKEERYTLERAMTNAGYRWNKEKLKLEKI